MISIGCQPRKRRVGISLDLIIHRYYVHPVYYYDKDAPTKVGATQTPSLVRILWTLLVTGLIQAASLVSEVVKP